jgi:hypothetical protein
MYAQLLTELLNDQTTTTLDGGDVIFFDHPRTGHSATLRLNDEQCDFFIQGARKAIFQFSRGMMIVALRRAVLESL